MTPTAESNLGALRQLWTRFSRFIIALEDARDPMEEYTLSLANRVEKLEHDLARLERQLHSGPHAGGTSQSGPTDIQAH
jgi:hypothetical protein